MSWDILQSTRELNVSKILIVKYYCVGARLYFTTTAVDRFEDRPSKLYLIHVRMPPGYAPSARPERPFMVHAAYYRQGKCFLSS